MSQHDSDIELKDIVIKDKSLGKHGLRRRPKGSVEELSGLATGPSSTVSELSNTNASQHRKEFFDPQRTLLGRANIKSQEHSPYEGPSTSFEAGESAQELSGPEKVHEQSQQGEIQPVRSRPVSLGKARDLETLDSPFSFHGQHSVDEQKHLEKAAVSPTSQLTEKAIAPFLQQDASNVEQQSYEVRPTYDDLTKWESLKQPEKEKKRAKRLQWLRRKKREEDAANEEDKKGITAADLLQDSDADFGSSRDSASTNTRRRRGVHWYNFYKRRQFYRRWLPVLLTAGLLIASGILVALDHDLAIVKFKIWRYGFFLGCLYPVWWIGFLVIHLIVLAMESTFFTSNKVIYFMYGLRKPLANLVRACLLLGLFVAIFRGPTRTEEHRASQELHDAYGYVVKALACIILWTFVFVVARFCSRAMSMYFHQKAYFSKMQSALQKEYYLSSLLQPRRALPKAKELVEKREDGAIDVSGTKNKLLGVVERKYKQVAGTDKITDKMIDKIATHDKDNEPHTYGDSFHGGQGIRLPAKPIQRTPSEEHNLRRAQDERPDDEAEGRMGAARSESATSDHSAFSRPHRASPSLPSYHSSESEDENAGFAQGHGGYDPHRRTSSLGSARRRASEQFGVTTNPVFETISLQGSKSAKPQPSARGVSPPASSVRSSKWRLRTKQDPPSDRQSVLRSLDAVPRREGQSKKAFNFLLVRKLDTAEKHLRTNKLKVTFAEQLQHAQDDSLNPKKLAFALFWNIKPFEEQRDHVIQEDLRWFLPKKKIRPAFEMLDTNHDGKVTLRDCRTAVTEVAQERRDLSSTLRDSKTVVAKLEVILLVVLHIILLLIIMLIFSVNVSKVWITASSVLIAFSFIFSKVISELFESIIFLFFVRPFDAGDGIFIDLGSGALHTVEEVALQSCRFMRWDGAKVYYPTYVLARTPFINMSRSGFKWESFIVYIDMASPPDTFDVLRQAITEHCKKPEADLTGRFACCNYGAGNPLKIRVGIYFEHTHCGTDLGRLNNARHQLFMLICQKFQELGIKYSMPHIHGRGGMGADPTEAAEAAQTLETTRPYLGQPAHHRRQEAMDQPASEVGHPPFMPMAR